MPMPADSVPLGTGVTAADPTAKVGYYVSAQALQAWEDGPAWRLDDFDDFVDAALQGTAPGGCFRGLNRHGMEDGYCLACRPSAGPAGMVLVVFVMPGPPGFSGPTVFDWGWRPEDREHPGCPLGWQTDFGSMSWRR